VNRWLRSAAWILFAATMYLILTEAVWPWIPLPDLSDTGFTLVFVLFAFVHCVAMEGWGRTGIFFAVSAIVSYLLEEIGVRTGMVFGHYHYSDMLGARLGHVPVLIPLAWFMMIYPSWTVACALLSGINTRTIPGLTCLAAIAACVMTGWDAVMDPGMSAEGNWIWENGGAYFGVPRHNYFGWLLTTFIVYWLAGWLWRNRPQVSATRIFAALPVIVYAFFAIRYVTNSWRPPLQIVALFSMVVPSFAALIQLALNRKRAPDHIGGR